ncbi:MAG: arginyl-transferase family protein [Alphaproteobacteria bacterium]|nr:arginyl-transferase family protein [Alphaproteobacteria bacterium]
MNQIRYIRKSSQFYLSNPAPCPYLKGQIERKVFTYLTGPRAEALNDSLTRKGFRRSQTIAYKPACETCTACISVRVNIEQFKPTRSLKRILNKNKDIEIRPSLPHTTRQQYQLLNRYLEARHKKGGMADMTSSEYISMVEDTQVSTYLVEYCLNPNKKTDSEKSNIYNPHSTYNMQNKSIDNKQNESTYNKQNKTDSTAKFSPIQEMKEGKLVATALVDKLSDGLSMVYSFFDPSLAERSLGSFMILDQIERARKENLPYLYLGYWVADCQNMAYKQRFQPLEKLTDKGWQAFTPI